MRKIPPDCVIALSADQVCCELDGRAVILNSKTGHYYGLDEVGSRVWTLLQESRSMGELRDVLLSEFDVEPETCEQDLSDLIQKLNGMGLVRIQF